MAAASSSLTLSAALPPELIQLSP